MARCSPFIDPRRKENFCGRCERGFCWGLAWAALSVLFFSYFFFPFLFLSDPKPLRARTRTRGLSSSEPNRWDFIFRAVRIRLLKGPENGDGAPTEPHSGHGRTGEGGGISAAVLSRSAPFVSSPFHPSILPSIHPFLRPSVHLSVHPSARMRAASHRASRTEPSPYGRDHSGSRSAVVPPGAPSGPGPSRPLPARGHDSSSTKSADRWTLRGPARGEGPRGCARPWRALTSHSSYLMLSVSFQSIFMGRRERVRSPRRGAAERGGAVQSRCALSARRSPSNGRNFSLLQRFTRSRSASLA